MDYQGNANKDKEEPKEKPGKKIEPVVTGEVIQRKRGIGRKFKEVFLGDNLKNSANYVVADVIFPGLRDMLWDAIANGAKRMIYGESRYHRGRPHEMRSRVQYNNPINVTSRVVRDPREIGRLPDQRSYRSNRHDMNDIILVDRKEAELVVERLIDIIDMYEVVSLADLYELLDLESPNAHVDNKWGWTSLRNVEIRQVREGYLIDLPPLEEINARS